jgi:hypothetical protein
VSDSSFAEKDKNHARKWVQRKQMILFSREAKPFCFCTAFAWSVGADPENPLDQSVEAFQHDLAVNTVSAYAAAQAAVQGFQKLPQNSKQTFIYTGNAANTVVSLELSMRKCIADYS